MAVGLVVAGGLCVDSRLGVDEGGTVAVGDEALVVAPDGEGVGEKQPANEIEITPAASAEVITLDAGTASA